MIYKIKGKKLERKVRKYDKGNKVIFISQASANMCWARLICKFVIGEGHVPVNYFTSFGHFVHEIADLQTMIDSINSLIVRCDELWAFGKVSEGMWFEIKMCKELGLPIRYFCIKKLPGKIVETEAKDLKYLKKFRLKVEKDNKFVPIEEL